MKVGKAAAAERTLSIAQLNGKPATYLKAIEAFSDALYAYPDQNMHYEGYAKLTRGINRAQQVRHRKVLPSQANWCCQFGRR